MHKSRNCYFSGRIQGQFYIYNGIINDIDKGFRFDQNGQIRGV